MRFYADLHVHSKYSRATSRDCDLENLAFWGRKKGITVIGTGDFTHPAWTGEIKEKLVPAEPGLFRLREDIEKEVLGRLPPVCRAETRFMLSVEVSTIYKKGEKTRKVHHLIYAPAVEQAERISKKLSQIGNIRSDGRPILGLDSRHLLEIVLEAGEGCYLVPAHIWTPWFSVLGSKSGFDTVTECYGDLAPHVFAAETGLSSDPEMNWRVSSLDPYRLVSNSDAHSPQKLGREATVFHTDLNYFSIREALETGKGYGGTVEFFPEEGKYHLDGHRKCNVRFTPEESRKHRGLCPACKKPLTIGVMYRVEELADRPPSEPVCGHACGRPKTAGDYQSLIPLPEIISEIHGTGSASKKVVHDYEKIIACLGPELGVLNSLPLDEIRRTTSELIAEAISRMRRGTVIREAGYDGEYGVIRLFDEEELKKKVSAGVLFDLTPLEAKIPAGEARGPSAEEIPAFSDREGLPVHEVFESRTDLDQDQLRALEIMEGPLLIMAGPGSGKTRTLTHRIAHLIREGKAHPQECLTITFTRRASREMQARLKQLVPDLWRHIPVTTFHGFCFGFLQGNRVTAGLPRGFRVADDLERLALLSARLDCGEKKGKALLREISRLKRTGAEASGSGSGLSEAWNLLEKEKEGEGVLDYDDLVLETVRLLEEDADLRRLYRRKYPYLSVDEFQDIDALQYRLIRLLVPENGNLCVIGDPDQAIYGFRGADVRFFLAFQKDFPSTLTVHLSRNYRTGKSIVKASAQMIAPSTLLKDRSPNSILEDTGKVVIHHARTDKAEAEFVVHTIERMIGGFSFFSMDSGRAEADKDKDYGFQDFAVLYRAESLLPVLEEALHRSGLPYRTYSHTPFYANPEVRKILKRLAEESKGEPVTETLKALQKQRSASHPEKGAADESVFAKLFVIAESAGEKTLESFLSGVQLARDIDTWDERAGRVSLMTLHASKGLEFPVVFIVGCEDGLLPLRWSDEITGEEEAEERRLFYVGMTRAKDKLFLSHASRRFWQGKVRERQISPFLKDVEEELLERHASVLRKPALKNPQIDLL